MIPPESFTTLLRLLDREEEAWQGLLDALASEAEAVKTQHLDSINASIQRKGEAVSNLSLVVEQKQHLIEDIAQKLGLSNPVEWKSIIEHASSEQRKELTARREKFAAWAKTAREKNEENAILIEAALDVVDNSLHFLRRLIGEETHYDRGGNISARPLQGKIVSKRG